MKILTAVTLAVVLSGCTVADVVREKAAGSMDAALITSETVICNDSSVGAIKRKYCSTKEGCRRWLDFCYAGGMDVLAE